MSGISPLDGLAPLCIDRIPQVAVLQYGLASTAVQPDVVTRGDLLDEIALCSISRERLLGRLAESLEPDRSAIDRWLNRAKALLDAAKVGTEIAESAKKLFELFNT